MLPSKESNNFKMTGKEFEETCSNYLSCEECPNGKLKSWGEHACSIENEEIDWSDSNE